MIDLEELEKMVDQALAKETKESWEQFLNEENKMKDQVLSIQRMQHLKELGVDTSKASMCWMKYRSENASWILSLMRDIVPLNYDTHEIVPAYTFQNMLEMMPDRVKGFDLVLFRDNHIQYEKWDGIRQAKILVQFDGKNLLEVVYNMLCWLAENKLLGKEEK